MYQRDDDNLESFQTRFNTYVEKTQPIIDYYKNMNNYNSGISFSGGAPLMEGTWYNPKTGDRIVLYLLMLAITFAGIIVVTKKYINS